MSHRHAVDDEVAAKNLRLLLNFWSCASPASICEQLCDVGQEDGMGPRSQQALLAVCLRRRAAALTSRLLPPNIDYIRRGVAAT